MHESTRRILQSFAESAGDADVLAKSLQQKELIAQLPHILGDREHLTELTTAYLRRHPELAVRSTTEYAGLDDEGFVIAIVIFALKELKPTPELNNVIDQLTNLQEQHRKL